MERPDQTAESYTVTAKDVGVGRGRLRLVARGGLVNEMPEPSIATAPLEQHFRSLANRWRDETRHTSNINKAIAHSAYQQIIGMGKAAPNEITPLLLRELERDLDHWFVALVEITGFDAAAGEDTVTGAAQKWLEWGRGEGHFVYARSSA